MRKKYEKVDLKSDAFKIKKTPQKKPAVTSRSPTSKSPNFISTPSAQKIDPNQLFQKVCCPNCKYLFKIIKNNELFVQSATKKKDPKKSVLVQTQQNFESDVKLLSRLNSQINQTMNQKMSQSLIFKSSAIKRNTFKSFQNQKQVNKHIRSLNYAFQEKSPFKSSNLAKQRQQVSEKQLPQALKSPLSANSKKNAEIKMNLSQAKLYSKQQIQNQFTRHLRQQLGEELSSMISQNMKNQKSMSYISQFYAQLPQTIQKSAIAKMLLHQFQAVDRNNLYFS